MDGTKAGKGKIQPKIGRLKPAATHPLRLESPLARQRLAHFRGNVREELLHHRTVGRLAAARLEEGRYPLGLTLCTLAIRLVSVVVVMVLARKKLGQAAAAG